MSEARLEASKRAGRFASFDEFRTQVVPVGQPVDMTAVRQLTPLLVELYHLRAEMGRVPRNNA